MSDKRKASIAICVIMLAMVLVLWRGFIVCKRQADDTAVEYERIESIRQAEMVALDAVTEAAKAVKVAAEASLSAAR
jgi:hypothetical protein